MERDRGIEPLSTAWKAEAQASIPIPLRLFQILKHKKNILSSIFFIEIYSLISEYYRRFFSCCKRISGGTRTHTAATVSLALPLSLRDTG